MKKTLSIIISIIMLAVMTATTISASAASQYSTGTYVINVSQGVNVRKGPSTSYAKVTAIPNKKQITISDVRNTWGYCSEYRGWICLDYAKYVAPQSKSAAIGQYIITAKEGVNIRTNAGTNYKKIGAVQYNTTVTVTSIKNNWGYCSEYRGWICLDFTKQIKASNNTIVVSSGIPSSAYKKTGVVYTVSGTSYYQAKTTREYNGVDSNTLFFVDANGTVINNAATLNKLQTLVLFENMRQLQKEAVEGWVSAADDYYDICTNVAKNEKLGRLVGTSSSILLRLGIGESVSVGHVALELSEEIFASDTVKSAALLALIQVYANNTIAYGNQAASLMKNEITDFDILLKSANLYAQCSASFAAVDYLAGEQVIEMANSSTWKELKKYFQNVFCGFADKEYIEDGIMLRDIAIDCGAVKIYDEKLAEQNKYLSATYAAAKAVADKLTENEWDSLVGKTVASIKNGSSYSSWYSPSKNVSAQGGYYWECTHYALGRFGEVTGVKLTKAPHAKYWLSTNKNNPDVTIVYGANKIVSRSIAVDTSGTYGHVMFIENVAYDATGNPKTVYFSECNWDSNSTYNAGRDCVVKKMSYSQFVIQRNPEGYIIAK